MKRVIISQLQMKSLENRSKTIRVFLPKDYDETDKYYPVLYMHDGQNLMDSSPFSGHSWDILTTLDALHDLTGGIIVVGIDSDDSRRLLEYTPVIHKSLHKYLRKQNIPETQIKAEADAYGNFILRQLKPIIDQSYRTKPKKHSTWMAGSSCGAIISLYLGLKYQDQFSCIGAFSPAYWFGQKKLTQMIKAQGVQSDICVYHDMGTQEGRFLNFLNILNVHRFHRLLVTHMASDKVMKIIDSQATHSELYWAKRFPEFIKFISSKYL